MLTAMSIIVPLVVGAIVMFLAQKYDLRDIYRRKERITWPEFALGGTVIVAVAVVVTILVGPSLARDSAVNGYNEFYNGSVISAYVNVDHCTEDGGCVHNYTCDEVWHPAVYDSKGDLISAGYMETHQCPDATEELNYRLQTNTGRTVDIASGYFDSHPVAWRGGHGIPSNVPRQPPQRWLQAKHDLAAGMSDPVTDIHQYANFVLATDGNLYKQYSANISTYRKAGLLPKHTAGLDNHTQYDYGMRANKLQVVGGLKVANLQMWENRLMDFNAALGINQQGDMHVVVVPASKVSNPDSYINALKGYWQSLGKWSISKNGIILAIGVSSNGSTVTWARSQTGMPTGNGEMETALNTQLVGVRFTPEALLGHVTASVNQTAKPPTAKYNESDSGAIGKIVFTKFPFQRACMKCASKGDHGVGFVNLQDLVPISTSSKILMFIVVLFMSAVLWAALLVFDPLGSIFPSSSSSEPASRLRRRNYY